MLFDKPFVTLPKNRRGRDFCIGDLHGCYAMLNRLLEAACFDSGRDRLLSVGDLVHRGPSSVECLKMAEKSWFFPVMGNHEAMQQGAYRGEIGADGRLVVQACEYDGPDDPLRPGRKDQRHIEQILDRLPLALEFTLSDGRRVGIVHAGLPIEWSWLDVQGMIERDSRLFDKNRGGVQADLLWDRAPMVSAALASLPDIKGDLITAYSARDRYRHALANQPVAGIDLLLSGHTTLRSGHPLSTGNRVYLDTGAGMIDGRLTMLDLLKGSYWQVADPRLDPELSVTEYPSVPLTQRDLVWLTEEEWRTAETFRAARPPVRGQ
ncbi:metallophosphoesterase [Solimonas sp. SE-A11]|uniref:metallophosphoesterase n=1 Tax=Solimonas sp. SE-A11 TaxID=3054954 RepID=UPI00259CA5CB|nr:metallophosphoesterase [Solimonas sp. SE-A11]MDM4772856.1 metallophosphoesterase [Solimonas sp. SE-A11]